MLQLLLWSIKQHRQRPGVAGDDRERGIDRVMTVVQQAEVMLTVYIYHQQHQHPPDPFIYWSLCRLLFVPVAALSWSKWWVHRSAVLVPIRQ